MDAARIESALKRIEAAMARIAAARAGLAAAGPHTGAGGGAIPGGGSARVVELVNAHEKLREQVAESLRELDAVLASLEEQA
ncbi:hypothetical protein [Erythrobacter cryptus]|uniref:hypothetical protein n=1 Tax=Erythrobacter cryptus TaxID=196588 RepID=UPI0004111BA0|nr:hypothetical protein [Erythrobacter cryptus]